METHAFGFRLRAMRTCGVRAGDDDASMKRPRLLIAVTSPMSAGFFHGQLAWLREVGYEVHFLCGPGQPADTIVPAQGAIYHTVPLERGIAPWRDVWSLWQVMGVLRRVRPDIINAGTPKAGMLVLLAAWLCQVPVSIYTIHGLRFETVRGPLRSLLISIERMVCAAATQVLCVSGSLRKVVLQYRLAGAGKVAVLANGSINGIDTDGFIRAQWLDAGRDLRRSLDIPLEAPVIGFVGRAVRDKGIRELVAAWAEVQAQIPSVHLLIVGDVESGDRITQEDERTLRSDPRVHITGFVTEVRPAYAAMEVLVLPTYREGLGLVLLEAGAMELPVVASDIPGCRDAVVAGVTGVLVPVRDSPALAAAILAYLNDPPLRTDHGLAGSQYVRRRFTRRLVWQSLADYYQDIVPAVPAAQPLV